MIVIFGSAKFKVSFIKNKREVKHNGKPKQLIDTYCKIYLLKDGEVNFTPAKELVCGIARQNILDKYNKIIGKKVVLQRAIDTIQNLTFNCAFPKTLRTCFWIAFNAEFRRWN